MSQQGSSVLSMSTSSMSAGQENQQRQQQEEQPLALYPRIISGIAGSIATSLVVQPLEVVKVRQQSYLSPAMQQASSSTTSTFICPQHGVVVKQQPPFGIAFVNNSRPPGTFQMMNMIWKTEGIRGLYAGLRPGLVMYIPSTVLYFTAYEDLALRMKRWNNNHREKSKSSSGEGLSNFETTVVPLVAGSLARILATTVTSPLEFMRTRQAGGITDKSSVLFKNDKSIFEGITHMYRGLVPTLWRDVPFSGLYWLGVETIRRQLEEYQTTSLSPGSFIERLDKNVIRAGNSFVSGAISGMFAAAFTTPFDVVKTRYQMDLVGSGPSSSSETVAESVPFKEQSKSSSPSKVSGRGNRKSSSLFGGHSNHSSCHHHSSPSMEVGGCHTQASSASRPTTKTASSSSSSSRSRVKVIDKTKFKHLSSLTCICVEQYPIASKGGNGIWNQMTYIYQTEGIQGLWKGNVTRMIKVAPACAIMISSYEFGKSILGATN